MTSTIDEAPSQSKPLITVLVVNRNGETFLKNCIESVLSSTYYPLELLVIDCASTDGSRGVVADYNRAKCIPLSSDPGFAAANNLGATLARGEFVLLLNNDTFLLPDTIDKLASGLARNDAAAIVPVQYDWTGRYAGCGATVPWAGRATGRLLSKWGSYASQEPTYIAVACCLVRTQTLRRLPLATALGFYEDIEWSLRLRQHGLRLLCETETLFFHKIGGSSRDSPRLAYYIGRNPLATCGMAGKPGEVVALLPLLIRYFLVQLGYFLVRAHRTDCATALIRGGISTVITLPRFVSEGKRLRGFAKVPPVLLRSVANGLAYERYSRQRVPERVEAPRCLLGRG